MNRIMPRILLCLVLLLSPLSLMAAQNITVAVPDKELADLLADVPCVTIKSDAGLGLTLEKDESLVTVKDSQGVSYRAAGVEDALNGYLRMKDVCVIKSIAIDGAKRISSDAIRFRIKSAPGDILHKLVIKKDIEEIYAMGYFESCDASDEAGVLTFHVREYPVVINFEFKGNKAVDEKKLLETLGIKKFDILNTRTLKSGIDRIKGVYREKGYYDVEVGSSTKPTEGGIILAFDIKENEKLFVRGIEFDGNKAVKDKKLKKAIKTSARRWWNPLDYISDKGAFTETDIDTDLLRLEQYYGDQGYINAKVGRPIVDVKPGKGIYLTIPIEEGQLYHVGQVDAEGDLIVLKSEIMDAFGIKTGDVMSKLKIHAGMEKVRDIYMDKGYANVDITPLTQEKGTVINITLQIKKGGPVYIDEIRIKGNTKTRDKVIRRELKVQEGQLYSSTALKQSRDKLNRLGYFKEVNINQIPGQNDTTNLLVDVEENPTGAFTFGVAYSSLDRMMGTLEISENNLFGKGLRSRASIEYGARKKTYILDFEEPWLFDYPVTLGARLFNEERTLLYYDRKARGGNIRISYPLWEEVRHNITYTYNEIVGLYDIDPTYRYLLTADDIDGGLTSSITNTLYRDTTNDFYRPTRGNDSAVSLEYAGLGGDYFYTRTTARWAQFFPVYKDSVALMFKLRWGTINGSRGEKVPTTELFTLGGLNSIRGFRSGEVGPMDSFGNVLGGRRMAVFNTELTFPIGTVPGLSGVCFFDAGNAFNRQLDLTNVKKSYGAGIRWVTPMGPLRLEYGKVINPEEWENSGRWDFTIGTFF